MTSPRVRINEGQKCRRVISPKSVAMRALASMFSSASVQEVDGSKGQ